VIYALRGYAKKYFHHRILPVDCSFYISFHFHFFIPCSPLFFLPIQIKRFSFLLMIRCRIMSFKIALTLCIQLRRSYQYRTVSKIDTYNNQNPTTNALPPPKKKNNKVLKTLAPLQFYSINSVPPNKVSAVLVEKR